MNELPPKFVKHTAEFVRSHYVIIAPDGVHPDRFLAPKFWINHIERLQPLDLIEVIAENGSYELMLRVRGYVTVRNGDDAVEVRNGIVMRELDRKIFGDITAPAKPVEPEKNTPEQQVGDLIIKWGGPQHKFRILDGQRLIAKGYKTKGEAETAAKEYLAKLEVAA